MNGLKIGYLLAMGLSLISCGLSKKQEKPEPKLDSKAPQLIGRVSSVPADKRFVLIQSYGAAKFETGAILTTRGPDDRNGNLKVTGERMGQFVAADVQSGAPAVGDGVYSHHVPQPKAASPQPPASTAPAVNPAAAPENSAETTLPPAGTESRSGTESEAPSVIPEISSP